MITRRRGFTLIELLVVIAIIGILAAMIFPVFARARETARKIQCIANVKNIAMAINMYITDWEAFPPLEKRDEVITKTDAGGPYGWLNGNNCQRVATMANPYLRYPVILDEYVKSRDLWKCPSAYVQQAPGQIVNDDPNLYDGGWFGYYIYWADKSGMLGGSNPTNVGTWAPCTGGFPNGWGGIVTDTFMQNLRPNFRQLGKGEMAAKAFVFSIWTNEYSLSKTNLSKVDNPSAWISVADAGPAYSIFRPFSISYVEACCPAGSRIEGMAPHTFSDCPWARDCSIEPGKKAMRANDAYMKKFTRHQGGTNLGFVDGHAKWYMARAILNEMPRPACGCCSQGSGDPPSPIIWRGLKGVPPNTMTGACNLGGPLSAGGAPEYGIPEGDIENALTMGNPPMY